MSFNYTAPTETIETSGGNITVRGFSLDDLHTLIQRGHGESITPLIRGDLNFADLVTDAPALAADVIALAADAPDAAAEIARLPIGVQTRVLTAVYRLTFGEFDMGNLFRLLAKTIVTAQQAIRENSHI